MEIRKVNSSFWNGKKVYLTGHTGFKGSWLSLWLKKMGADLKGYALKPDTNPSLFQEAKVELEMQSEIGDIRDYKALEKSILDFQPEIVIHMAAQPLVRKSYQDPLETYSTNVMGTANLLQICREVNGLQAIVSVTTDKCYDNKEWIWGYRENEALGGFDPYSSSKACAELVTSAYRNSFFKDLGIGLASARAGNVIGGGDWSDDRLIPDILRSFENQEEVKIRNPLATRPWQHVLEPLSAYLILAEDLYQKPLEFSEAWNFGPKDDDCWSVERILDAMVSLWGEGAAWRLDEGNHPHEARFLKLDCSKAASRLEWQPKLDLKTTLSLIIDWHQAWLKGENAAELCLKEIDLFCK